METLGGLHAAFICAAREYPNHTAVVEPGEGSVTYRELAALSDRVRDRLAPAPLRPLDNARLALVRVSADAFPFFGGGSLTPARRALDRPIAMACFDERAPCFPSRT